MIWLCRILSQNMESLRFWPLLSGSCSRRHSCPLKELLAAMRNYEETICPLSPPAVYRTRGFSSWATNSKERTKLKAALNSMLNRTFIPGITAYSGKTRLQSRSFFLPFCCKPCTQSETSHFKTYTDTNWTSRIQYRHHDLYIISGIVPSVNIILCY